MKKMPNENTYAVKLKSTRRTALLKDLKNSLKEKYQKSFNKDEWERWIIDSVNEGDFCTTIELPSLYQRDNHPETFYFKDDDFWYENYED